MTANTRNPRPWGGVVSEALAGRSRWLFAKLAPAPSTSCACFKSILVTRKNGFLAKLDHLVPTGVFDPKLGHEILKRQNEFISEFVGGYRVAACTLDLS